MAKWISLIATLMMGQTPPSDLPVLEVQEDGWTESQVYTEAEKQKECKKFEGKVIGYYEHLYKVEKCRYREIRSASLLFKLNSLGAKVITVDGSTLAKLTAGEPINDFDRRKSKPRSCQSLSRRYVTFTYTEVYLVEQCKRRMFPDWASFTEHQKSSTQQEILALTWEEFYAIKVGQDMPSMLDKNYQQQKVMMKNVDVIPLKEACKGLNGKDVSYVDRIYRIENCRRREYDAQSYWRKMSARRLTELTSEQWISLPEGKEMKLK